MTPTDSVNDRAARTRQAYDTDDKLNVRYQTHEKYTVPRLDFKAWVLDCIRWQGNERVLDLGAGPGSYFAAVKARIPWGEHVAGDLSLGMVRRQKSLDIAAGSRLINLDAQTLPFADATFDVVLANHMLYHVPDVDKAVAEIRRVLKPQGILLAATNSINNMPELRTLYRRALLLLTNFKYQVELLPSEVEGFCLENAASILGRHFFAVARHDLPSALIFPEAEPVIAYLQSTRDLEESNLPEDVTWEEFVSVMEQQVRRLITYSGKMSVKKLAGAIVATDAGGFAAEYVRHLQAPG